MSPFAAGEDADVDERPPATAELVVEVAVTGEGADRKMAALDAEAGVKESWIVLAQRRQVEVSRRLEAGGSSERVAFAGNEESSARRTRRCM